MGKDICDAPSPTQEHTPLEVLLLAENAALTKALTGLTRGGSEYFIRKGDRFVADIPACVAYVQMVKQDAHRRTVSAILSRKAAEQRAAEAEASLAALRSSRPHAEESA